MVRGKTPAHKVLRLCGDCGNDTTPQCSLICGVCSSWWHSKCQNVSKELFKVWPDMDGGYTCRDCRTTDYGYQFDFLAGMKRLAQAAKKGTLKYAYVPPMREVHVNKVLEFNVDPVACTTLEKFGLQDAVGLPEITTDDGNCLFNAVSLLLHGVELRPMELRYRTCMKMIENEARYRSHPNSDTFSLLSPTYSKAVSDCATPGKHSCIWTVMALTDVLGIPLDLVYPPVNGSDDMAYKAFNVVFHPDDLSVHSVLSLMWTNVRGIAEGCIWTPNHFVPLRSYANPVFATPKRKCSNDSYDKSSPSKRQKTSIESTKESSKNSDIVLDGPTPKEVAQKAPCPYKFMSTQEILECLQTASSRLIVKNIPPGEKDDVFFVIETPQPGNKQNIPDDCGVWNAMSGKATKYMVSRDNHVKCVTKKGDTYCYSQRLSKAYRWVPVEPQNLITVRRYYTKLKACETYKKRVTTILGDLNCLNSTRNLAVVEYCGVNTSKTVNHDGADSSPTQCLPRDTFIREETTIENPSVAPAQITANEISLEDGLTKSMENKIRITTEVPERNTLQDSGTGHMKHTDKNKTDLMKVPVRQWLLENVEQKKYIKNEKLASTEVNATPLMSFQAKYTENKKVPAHDISLEPSKRGQKKYTDDTGAAEVEVNETASKPFGGKQVEQNTENKENDGDVQVQNSNNIDLSYIVSILHEHPFVQEVHFTKGKKPVVILYTEDQLTDFQANCIGENPSIINVETINNLGPCYITITSYKNQGVIQRNRGNHPIFLGPMMLHWEKDFQSYCQFFFKLRLIADNENLILGTNADKPIIKAMNLVFPKPGHLLCTKSLRDNVLRYLRDDVGFKVKDRSAIAKHIFGEDGVAYSPTLEIFESRINELETYFEKYPDYKYRLFKTYVDETLKKLLWNSVCKPLQDKTISKLWTNIVSKSQIRKLKQRFEWKREELPDLIELLYKENVFLLTELKRALMDVGEFKLPENLRHYRINYRRFPNTDPTEVLFQKFLKRKQVK